MTKASAYIIGIGSMVLSYLNEILNHFKHTDDFFTLIWLLIGIGWIVGGIVSKK